MSDQIQQDKFVTLSYTITDENNEILEHTDTPINYVHGRDNEVIEKIANALEGCHEGEKISVDIRPEEGFGDHQPELTFTDDPQQPAYYRLEAHTIHRSKVYRFVQWRDFATTQALTNPIWVGRGEMQTALTGGRN